MHSNTSPTDVKGNVLLFPKAEGFLGNTPEDVKDTLSKNLAVWIENLLPTICSSTFNEISKFGINLFDPALVYDMLCVQEACRSLMMASMKLEHPFQEMARETLDMDEYGGVTIYSFSLDANDDPEKDPSDPTGT